ncbi:hypothetical protein SHKM778_02220 [Streptomyces sp. KM77-8]|uniref:Helix-turn-helix domain-containing protein n=1 Tax=Streptomyces haneummycinicus TaxID=3074435 RepID=A0AAT9H8Y6_9ACTN
MSIAALCGHFSEGEILISRALRELEAAGYLERRRVRLPSGQIRTRTYFYDVPGGADPQTDPDPDPDGPPEPTSMPSAEPEPEAALSLADADPEAVAVLTALRRVDPGCCCPYGKPHGWRRLSPSGSRRASGECRSSRS